MSGAPVRPQPGQAADDVTPVKLHNEEHVQDFESDQTVEQECTSTKRFKGSSDEVEATDSVRAAKPKSAVVCNAAIFCVWLGLRLILRYNEIEEWCVL